MAPKITCECGNCRKCYQRNYYQEKYSSRAINKPCLNCEKPISIKATRCLSCSNKINASNNHLKERLSPNKTCTKCKVLKPKTEFGISRTRVNGLQSYCKSCMNTWSRERSKNNPEKTREDSRRRRVRLRNAECTLTKEEWIEIVEDFNGLCFWCGAPYSQQDHLVPVSKGGTHTANNVVPSCSPCNNSKNDKDPLEFLLEVSK